MSNQVKIVAAIGAVLIIAAAAYLIFAGRGDQPDAQTRGVDLESAVDIPDADE